MSDQTDALLRRVIDGVEGLREEVQKHLVDDERRHGEVLIQLKGHSVRIGVLESRGKWWRGILAALVVAASSAGVARMF